MKNIKNYINILLVLFILNSCNNANNTNSKKTSDSTINNGTANKDRLLPDSLKNHSSESGVLGTKSDAGKNTSGDVKK